MGKIAQYSVDKNRISTSIKAFFRTFKLRKIFWEKAHVSFKFAPISRFVLGHLLIPGTDVYSVGAMATAFDPFAAAALARDGSLDPQQVFLRFQGPKRVFKKLFFFKFLFVLISSCCRSRLPLVQRRGGLPQRGGREDERDALRAGDAHRGRGIQRRQGEGRHDGGKRVSFSFF